MPHVFLGSSFVCQQWSSHCFWSELLATFFEPPLAWSVRLFDLQLAFVSPDLALKSRTLHGEFWTS